MLQGSYYNGIEGYYRQKYIANTSDNTSFHRGWDAEEDRSLELGLMYWGCGRWRALNNAQICPGKKTTQIYLHTQRLVRQQALKPYSQLYVNIEEARNWNINRLETKETAGKNGLVYNTGGPAQLERDRDYVKKNFILTKAEREEIDVGEMFKTRDRFYRTSETREEQFVQAFYDLGYFSFVRMPGKPKTKKFQDAKARLAQISRWYQEKLDNRKKNFVGSKKFYELIEDATKCEKNISNLIYEIMKRRGNTVERLKGEKYSPLHRPIQPKIKIHKNLDYGTSKRGFRNRRTFRSIKRRRQMMDRRKRRGGRNYRDDDEDAEEFDWLKMEDDRVAETREPVKLRPRRDTKQKLSGSTTTTTTTTGDGGGGGDDDGNNNLENQKKLDRFFSAQGFDSEDDMKDEDDDKDGDYVQK